MEVLDGDTRLMLACCGGGGVLLRSSCIVWEPSDVEQISFTECAVPIEKPPFDVGDALSSSLACRLVNRLRRDNAMKSFAVDVAEDLVFALIEQ